MHDWNRSRMAVVGLAQLVRMPKWMSAAWALACLPPDRHVRRCVVSVSALSSPSCVSLSQLETECKPLPLSLAELVVSTALVGGRVLCPVTLPLARSALLRRAVGWSHRRFNSPAKGAELMHPEPRSEDAAPPQTSTPRP